MAAKATCKYLPVIPTHAADEGACSIKPTVFSGVSVKDQIAQEEIFGPVACLIKFKDEEEAVAIANDVSYGLAAAIHSNGPSSSPMAPRLGLSSRAADARQIHRVTRKLKAGTVWINQVRRGFKLAVWPR